MKICFFLQRYFSRLGNALAFELQREYGVTEFCGYVQTRHAEQFLKQQTDVHYSTLLIDEDIHQQYQNEKIDLDYLKKLETDYGIVNLWPYLLTDRHIMMNWPKYEYRFVPAYSHEDMLRLLQVKAKAIIGMLEKEKPDVVIFSVVGSMDSLLMYQIAKKKGIATLYIEPARIPGKIILSENAYGVFTGTEKIFQEISTGVREDINREQAVQFIENFRSRPAKSLWVPSLKPPIMPIRIAKMIGHTAGHLARYIRDRGWQDPARDNTALYLYHKTRRKLKKLRGLRGLYSQPREGEDFAFFPLNWEPEIEVSLRSQPYDNQIEVIRHIAKSLPVHYKLYVKEHPGMEEYRPRWYYKQILQIPNVRLIDVNYNTFALIQKTKLICVLSSTVGWEGILLKKPVITFGSVFYNALPMVYKASGYRELPIVIQQALNRHQHDDEQLINFVSAIYEDSITFDYLRYWFVSEYEEVKQLPELKRFGRYLMDRINAVTSTSV